MYKDMVSCHFLENFGINMKKIMNTARRTGSDAAKTVSKRVVKNLQKQEEI